MLDYVVLTSACVLVCRAGLALSEHADFLVDPSVCVAWVWTRTVTPAAPHSALVAGAQAHIDAACVPKCGSLP